MYHPIVRDDVMSIKTTITASKSMKGSGVGSKVGGAPKGKGSTEKVQNESECLPATALPQRAIGRVGSTSASVVGDQVDNLLRNVINKIVKNITLGIKKI